MEFRRATASDIDAFIQNRIEFVASITDISDVSLFERNTREYLIANIESNGVIVFIAVEEESIVSSCMACVYETAPLISCMNGKTAEILNVYTKEEYRRQGLARRLLEMLLDELKIMGVEKVVLEYRPDALALYESMGFTLVEKRMQLKLG